MQAQVERDGVPSLLASVSALFSVSALPTSDPHSTTSSPDPASHHAQPRILILGAGVSGIIAARTLHRHGHSKFLLIEAQGEIGGRLKSGTIGGHTSEYGANWIQDEKNVNPILCLALKHGQKTVNNGLYGSITTYSDTDGPIDYWSTIASADKAFLAVVDEAGAQIADHGPDLSVRWDFEYAQTPSQTSWMASSWAHNFTFSLYGDDNFLNIDQRGYKHFLQAEAATFLQPDQIVYNATVRSVDWDHHSSEHSTHTHPVNVTLANGTTLTADYIICTFSLGVLQNDEVEWVPRLPAWKHEAIAAFTMATYTKVFVHFAGEDRFWFDTEMALYASSRRGHYPLWQSLDVPANHTPQFIPGSRILFGTVTGDDALEISALSGATEEDVRADVKEVLQNMFPNATLPAFDLTYHDWAADPLFHGSYSNFPPYWDPNLHRNLRSSVGHGRLRWAGEAGSATWFGFLHGAYADGKATELIECIRLGDRRKDDFVLRPQGPGRAPVWPGH
ncbi:amine oxidase [Schizophyllum commune Tattone D]|nr:amine oxidase [Schizophyllum commune Tattone D]